MKKIMLIVLAAAALLLCGCGNEVQSDFNDECMMNVLRLFCHRDKN